jgi:hypothetical protein
MSLISLVYLVAVVALVMYRAIQISPSNGSRTGALLAILAGIAPAAWVVGAREVSPKLVIGYSVLFFVGSVLLKWMLFGLLSKLAYPHLPTTVIALVQGLVSATCEMGVAVLAFTTALPNLGVWQVFGFGAGAAAAEALILALMPNPHQGTAIGEYVAHQFSKLHEGPAWIATAVPFVERVIATTDHIACRGLVAAGVGSGRMWPTMLAFVAFAITDGWAGYCLGHKWEFSDASVAARLYGVMAVVAAVSAIAWALAVHGLWNAG